jgi:hypothetical protein
LRAVVETRALGHELQVRLKPQDLLSVLDAISALIVM